MKTSQLKMIIREVVREEIRLGLQEIIGDMKQPKKQVSQPVRKRKVVEKQEFSKNPIINQVLNETAQNEEWDTMGGEKYTSDKMGDVLKSSYGKMMASNDNDNPNGTLAAEMGVNPNDPAAAFLKKDYRAVMKAVDKKQRK